MTTTQSLPAGTVISIGVNVYRLMTATLVECAKPAFTPANQAQAATETVAQGV